MPLWRRVTSLVLFAVAVIVIVVGLVGIALDDINGKLGKG